MSSPRNFEREVTKVEKEYEQRKQGVRKRKRSGKIFNPGALDDEDYEENERIKGVKMPGNRVGSGKSIESIKRARALYDYEIACRTQPAYSDEEYPIYHSERNALAGSERFRQGFEAQYGMRNQPRSIPKSLSQKATRPTGDFPSVGLTSMNQVTNPSATLQPESYVPYSSMMGSKRNHKFAFAGDMPFESYGSDSHHRHNSYDTLPWNYKHDDNMVNQDLRLRLPHQINPLGTTARHKFHRFNPYQPSPTECSNDVQYDFSDTEEGNDDDDEFFFEKKRSQINTNQNNILPQKTSRWNKEDDTVGAGNSWIQRYRRTKEGANTTLINKRDTTRSEDVQRHHLSSAKSINEMRRPKPRVPENITIVSNSSSLDHETTKLRAAAFSQLEGDPPESERKTRELPESDSLVGKGSSLGSWPKFYFGSGTPGSSVIDFHVLVLTEESFQRSPLVTTLMMDDHVYTAQPITNQEQLQNAHRGDLEAIAREFTSMIRNCDRRSFISVEFVDYDKLENSGSFLLVIGELDIDDEDAQKNPSIGCVVTVVRGTLKGLKGIVKEIADSKVLLVMTENSESVTRWIPRKNIEVMDDLKILQHFESSFSTGGINYSKQQVHISRHQQHLEKNYHQFPDSIGHDARNDTLQHFKLPQTPKHPVAFNSKALAVYSPNVSEDSNSCLFSSELYAFDDEDKIGMDFDATFASILRDEGVSFPDERGTNGALETQIEDQITMIQGTKSYNELCVSGSMALTNDVSDCKGSSNQKANTSGGNVAKNHSVHWKENSELLADISEANGTHCKQVKQLPDYTESKMHGFNVCDEDTSSQLGRERPPRLRKPVAAIALSKRRFGDLQDASDLRSHSAVTISEFDMPPETLFKVLVNVNQEQRKGQSSNPLGEKSTFTEAELSGALSAYNNTVDKKEIDDSQSAWKFIESMSLLELKDKLKCMKLPANGRRQQLFEKLVTALMVDKYTPIEELPDMITKFNP
jgi:hypothetical protein